MIATLEKSSKSVRSGWEVRVAAVRGMDAETRAALHRLQSLGRDGGRLAVVGCFMPDPAVSRLLAAMGVAEHTHEQEFFRFHHIIIPYCGISSHERKRWSEHGHSLVDLSSPHVRRAQMALGLLRMEGAQPLVIGHHDDPETQAIASTSAGTRIIQDSTDTARLSFAPAFGVVCQTTLSPRRVKWLLEQLHMRYRDARVTSLHACAPAMTQREQSFETILDWCDCAVIVGKEGEASVEALVETALRKGKAAQIAEDEDSLDRAALKGCRRLALSAGAFATDDAIRAVQHSLR